MIPKIIHLCWLSGDPYPEKIQRCISSWEHHLPDYQIMLWDANRFDVDSTLWTKEAFSMKKYAFVADYIRFYAVYHYGGIYLDSDVEVLSSFNNLLNLPYFVGREVHEEWLEIAAFGAEKGCQWVKDCLDYYSERHFTNDGCPAPRILTPLLASKYDLTFIDGPESFKDDNRSIYVFPNHFFCGQTKKGEDGKLKYNVRSNTYCVHQFTNTWRDNCRGPLHNFVAGILNIYPNYLGRHFKFFNKKK